MTLKWRTRNVQPGKRDVKVASVVSHNGRDEAHKSHE
jgi:hypothetical protein